MIKKNANYKGSHKKTQYFTVRLTVRVDDDDDDDDYDDYDDDADDEDDDDDDDDDAMLALGEVSIEWCGLAAPKARVPVNDPSWPHPFYAENCTLYVNGLTHCTLKTVQKKRTNTLYAEKLTTPKRTNTVVNAVERIIDHNELWTL